MIIKSFIRRIKKLIILRKLNKASEGETTCPYFIED